VQAPFLKLMTNMEAMTKTKSDSGSVEDLLPHIKDVWQSPDPDRRSEAREIISTAAATLGSLPKGQRRRWTGWIGRDHLWRGQRVILPNGVVAEVYGIVRGLAAVQWPDPLWIEGVRCAVLPVDRLIVYKNPAARLMGKLKSGCVENPSERKAAACRRNGSMPCGPGKRRGRPRRP
jgi:hypothetical protein